MRIFEQHGMRREQALRQGNYSLVCRALGRYELSLERAEKAVSINSSLGRRHAVAFNFVAIAKSLARMGRSEESANVLARVMEPDEQFSGGKDDVELRIAVATALVEAGRLEEAIEQFGIAAQKIAPGRRLYAVFTRLATQLPSVQPT